MKFSEFLHNNKKTVTFIIVGVVIISGLKTFSEAEKNSIYIVGDRGNLIGIKREDIDKSQSIPLRIKAAKDGLIEEENVTIYFPGKENSKGQDSKKNSVDEFKTEIDNLIDDLGKTEGEIVMLPQSLEDGTVIAWGQEKITSNIILILLIPILILLVYEFQKSKIKSCKQEKLNSIKKSLPCFNNQLLLLLNSGLIFNDAFTRISDGYRHRDRKEYFGSIIMEIRNRREETNSSLITVMDMYSKELKVKEFSRLVTIISDNQYKGVNLSEKLETEGELLWNQRKKQAEEKGRLAETKLTFPLAMLLLVLVLITAAPAIIQI